MTQVNYYQEGNKQGSYYRDLKDQDALEIYNRFSKQPDYYDEELNQHKLDFMRGWKDAIMD